MPKAILYIYRLPDNSLRYMPPTPAEHQLPFQKTSTLLAAVVTMDDCSRFWLEFISSTISLSEHIDMFSLVRQFGSPPKT